MEQQPVRRRRRRRRRSSRARREGIAWLTYFFGLAQRISSWVWLLLILTGILALGLGAPLTPFDGLLAFWGHW